MPEGSHPALHQGPMGEESPQLSSSLSGGDHVPDSCAPVCMEPLDSEGERPVSLVSTLSSGSSRDSSSLFGSTPALLAPTTPPIPSEEDIDLELVPTEETTEHCGNRSPTLTSSMGRFQKLQRNTVNLWNNNNGTTDREISHILSSPVIRGSMAPNPKLTYLDRVVMEIIETERTYVRDLRSIVEDYLACIIDMNNLPIRPEQVCALFGNIEDIYEFNSELLQSLDMCENDPVAIAQCFVIKSEYFEIYTQYCTNYPNSVAALTDCMRSKTLAKFFRDRQAALKHSLPLGSYLLKPVQRILKYHLLLQEIAKHFDPDEKGYEVIQEAMNTMTGVAWYINDMKRKHEHAVRVQNVKSTLVNIVLHEPRHFVPSDLAWQEIQSLLINWKGPDLTTYGELVLEGTFHVLRAKNTRTLFLFDKMLLITKKRGEHYVYKTHISCSTLMLLDSAKDPLLFSVIHFKHPKQPHTVQAKTVEEKRLWSHHIKRLILENHNAIVPQRTKEAILDTSNYPGKYQYSPERLKKAESNHNDEFHLGKRNGRRRSEPVKERIGTKAVLKHADSEGALLGPRCSLQPATSVDTLTSGLGEPLAPRPCEEDLFPRGESLEKQSPAAGGDGDELNLCSSLGEMEESYKEDILPGDEQVADFASSVLAAISCWHYRARALLSTHFTTDEQSSDAAEEKTTSSEEAECLSLEEKEDDGAVEEPVCTKVNQQDSPPPNSVPQSKESSHQYPDSPVTPSESNTETPEPHDTSNETAEEAVSDSSGLHAEEASVLTNSELSEDDEVLSDAKGMLSSSELDQASVTTENFVEGTLSRRSSLVSEDLGRVSCSSPEDNYTFQIISTCTDSEKFRQTLQPVSDHSLSVQEPALNDITAKERRSTLSNQDRHLIHKIRKYYEHAEYQDANFSIKRRESLSYIPAGLVRNLSRQLNSTPQENPVPVHRKELSRNRPTSWSVFDLPGLERSQNVETCLKSPAKPRSCSMTDTSNTEEEFRSSSDMLKVWQDMEIEEENREGQQEVTGMNLEVMQDIDSSDVKSSEPLSPVLEEEPGCVTSTDGSLPPITSIPGAGYESASDSTTSKITSFQDNSNAIHSHSPNIISARTSTEEDQILQDMGKMRNKVFQLARQYSQRIKNNRPIVWSRTREATNQQGLRGLPAVHEEKVQRRKKGKPNLRLPLTTCDQAVIHEVDFPNPVQMQDSGSSTDGTISSPQSPESFHWPDVQELRSKYTGTCLSSTVTRSHTVPSGMLEFCSDQCADKYLSFSDLHQVTTDCSVKQEDCPGDQTLLCTWSSLDHVLGSLPLLEVQNLQESGPNSKHQDRNSLHYEGMNCSPTSAALSLGKSSESNLVKSLRQKFMNK